jgi:hypothetical protein
LPVLDPNNVDALTIRGLSYGTIGEYDKAMANLEDAIRLDPEVRFKWIH